MIHYVGIPVHPFRTAGSRDPYLVTVVFGHLVGTKFAAAKLAEDNEKDTCCATIRNGIPEAEAGPEPEFGSSRVGTAVGERSPPRPCRERGTFGKGVRLAMVGRVGEIRKAAGGGFAAS